MKKLVGVLITLMLITTSYASNLIVNGDFEEPKVKTPKVWSTYYGQNFTGVCDVDCNGLIPGWSILWTDDLTPGRIELQRGPVAKTAPFLNDQKAELDSHYRKDSGDNNVLIYQEIEVCEGEKYNLSYEKKVLCYRVRRLCL